MSSYRRTRVRPFEVELAELVAQAGLSDEQWKAVEKFYDSQVDAMLDICI